MKKTVFLSKRLILFLIIIFIFFINASGNVPVDTTTSATELLDDIPKVDNQKINPENIQPKTEPKIDNDNSKTEIPEKIVNEKKEEIKIETQTIDDIIVLSAGRLNENKSLENKYRETKLIIFDNSNEKIPSSLTFEFEEEKTDEKRYYETENFTPKTPEEFYLSRPVYFYDTNKIVKSGKLNLSTSLGEDVFKNAFELFKKGEIKNSRIIFEKLIFYNHRVPESAYYSGLCYYLEKNNITAISYLNYAVDTGMEKNILLKQISVFYFQIGNIYYELDDFKKAIENYSLALEKNPSNYNVYNGMGLAYYKSNEIDNALNSWKKGMDEGNANCEVNYKWLSERINK